MARVPHPPHNFLRSPPQTVIVKMPPQIVIVRRPPQIMIVRRPPETVIVDADSVSVFEKISCPMISQKSMSQDVAWCS